MDGLGNNKPLDVDDLYSIYTKKLMLAALKAKMPEKYYAPTAPEAIVETIMADAEIEWKQKMKTFGKNKRMQKACMRNIIKKSRAAYQEKAKNNLHKVTQLVDDREMVDIWFDAVHAGYDDFVDDLATVMLEVTGMPWADSVLKIKEGNTIKTFDVTIPAEDLKDGIYGKVCGYEDVFCDCHGNMMSLENYLRSEIDHHRLIIKGEKGIRTFDEDEILLNRSYMHTLPCIAMPLKPGDRDMVRDLAKFFERAEEELCSITFSEDKNCKNEYFTLFPKLNDQLLAKINEQKRALERENEEAQEAAHKGTLSKKKEYKQSVKECEEVLESRLAGFRQDKLPNEEIYLVKE